MALMRATRVQAWTHDARNRVAVGRGVRLRYVSRADVKFMHDEIFERECYGCAAIADAARNRIESNRIESNRARVTS